MIKSHLHIISPTWPLIAIYIFNLPKSTNTYLPIIGRYLPFIGSKITTHQNYILKVVFAILYFIIMFISHYFSGKLKMLRSTDKLQFPSHFPPFVTKTFSGLTGVQTKLLLFFNFLHRLDTTQ